MEVGSDPQIINVDDLLPLPTDEMKYSTLPELHGTPPVIQQYQAPTSPAALVAAQHQMLFESASDRTPSASSTTLLLDNVTSYRPT